MFTFPSLCKQSQMGLVMKLLPLFVCFCLLFCWILNQAYND